MSKILINKKQLTLLENSDRLCKVIEDLIMSTVDSKDVCGVTVNNYKSGTNLLNNVNEKYLQATVYFKNNALNWENNSKKTFILNEIWTVCYDYTGVALSLVSKPC
jgi:hypothetical protein